MPVNPMTNNDVPYPEYLVGKMNMIELLSKLVKVTQVLWQSSGAEYSLFPATIDEPRFGMFGIISADGKKSTIYSEQIKVALLDGKMVPVMSLHETCWEVKLKKRTSLVPQHLRAKPTSPESDIEEARRRV